MELFIESSELQGFATSSAPSCIFCFVELGVSRSQQGVNVTWRAGMAPGYPKADCDDGGRF